ncbi:MAG: heparan-alpha-glucosaminide N-acetyltransferase domain-containing protein [Ferruginibacter sp.]
MQKDISQNQKRIISIDLLRGLVMVIMALDHVRDYFHAGAFLYNPLDLDKTNTVLFFTRWLTHFCAPVFMFLAGSSAFLTGQKKTKKELSVFLLKRGLWLIFIELVIANFGWNFAITFPAILFIVIWALGISMIVLAALIHLPVKMIFLIGIILVGCHNLLDDIHVEGNNLPAFGWSLLHEMNFFHWQTRLLFVGYPVLPWIGVMALGYCLGNLYAPTYGTDKRKKTLLLIGSSAIGLFILLRLINLYGDSFHWSQQKSTFFTFLSFINTSKYPPSLLYILMTLGPAVLFLAFTERANSAVAKFISVYGRVPMFYYLVHIYLIHLTAMLFSELFTTLDWRTWILNKPLWFNDELKGYGFSLGIVYLVWLSIVIGLYPLCKWYDRYKQTHKEKWWLSYL